MRYILAIWVIIVLIGLLTISLINLEDYGTSGVILAAISVVALYRMFKLLFGRGRSERDEDDGVSNKAALPDPLDYIIYGDIVTEGEPDKWDSY